MSADNVMRLALPAVSILQTQASAATVNGTAIDVTGYEDITALLAVGAVTGTGVTIDVKVQTSVDSGFTVPIDITGAVFATLDQDDDNTVKVGRFPSSMAEQYIRFVLVLAGTTPSVAISCTALLGKPTKTIGDTLVDFELIS